MLDEEVREQVMEHTAGDPGDWNRDLQRRPSAIAVAPIPNEGLGEAINDRLQRAAAPRG